MRPTGRAYNITEKNLSFSAAGAAKHSWFGYPASPLNAFDDAALHNGFKTS
jgi:hypothetical protein